MKGEIKMRARLPEERNRGTRLDPNRIIAETIKAELKHSVEKQTRESINENAGRYDTILAYVLNEKYGFGRKRITDFLREIIDRHIYTTEKYGEKYQDSAYYLKLKEKGIDMREIEEELDAYAKERGLIV